MPYTLVVVDMQYLFKASNKVSTIKNCKNAILKAMKHSADIVFLEFVGFGKTMKCLTDLTDSYCLTYFLRKDECDGSSHINLIHDPFKLRTKHFKIAGVNTDVCVQYTVSGLSPLFPDSVIEVLAKACNSEENHKYGLEVMESYSNVIINNQAITV